MAEKHPLPFPEVYDKGQPGGEFALPEGKALNQTFRMIIQPNLWGITSGYDFQSCMAIEIFPGSQLLWELQFRGMEE